MCAICACIRLEGTNEVMRMIVSRKMMENGALAKIAMNLKAF